MKHSILKQLMLIAVLWTGSHVSAADFKVNGIHYNILSSVDMTCEVTYEGSSSYYSNEYSGNIVIPETVTYSDNTYTVVSIGYEAFANCDGVSSISIPNTVTSISTAAFSYCTNMTSITLPTNLDAIYNRTFEGCFSLSSIDLPGTITEIGWNAFMNCSGLTSIEIPTSVTMIDMGAFRGCSKLVSVTVPSSVQNINAGIFTNCTSLKEVIFECEVISLQEMFNGCTSLTEFVIPNSVKDITGAFKGCTSLTTVTIPSSVTTIGDETFSNCTSLTSVVIPSGVEEIGISAFENCSSLESVEICNGVKTIGAYAFSNCTALTSITIPESVHTIEQSAFAMCSNLVEIHLESSTPPYNVESYAFDGISDKVVVYVPEDAVSAYQSNASWNAIGPIVAEVVVLEIQNSYYNTLRLFVIKGKSQKIQIIPTDDRFILNTIIFNEEDVTDELSTDGTYSTPILNEDAVLNISFTIPTAQNAPIQDSRIKAYGHRENIVVSGCEAGETITIYNTDGVQLRSQYATGNTVRITMPTNAVYIVKVNETAIKVAL